MINNSSLQKWDRLKQKQLDNQFINEIKVGMSCSDFEAKGILNKVYDVYQPFFDNSGSLRSGQILFQVVSVEAGVSRKLSECPQKTVVLTLDYGEEDLIVREKEGVDGLRRYRLLRICEEAFQQGGILTVEDIANRLLNCGQATISRDIKAFKDQGIILPLRSTIKDMGRSLSHRTMIVKEWLLGNEYYKISKKTHHSIQSVKNYVDKFKRVISLAKENYDFHTIAFLIKLSSPLVEEYYNLFTTLDIVSHRKEELEKLSKKNNS